MVVVIEVSRVACSAVGFTHVLALLLSRLVINVGLLFIPEVIGNVVVYVVLLVRPLVVLVALLVRPLVVLVLAVAMLVGF